MNELRTKPPLELDASKVLFAIRGSEVDVRKCFLRSAPRSRGHVRLSWEVDAEGKAFGIRVEDASLKAKAAFSCLIDGIRQFRFERSRIQQRASWTFVYRLQGTLAPGKSDADPQAGPDDTPADAEEEGLRIDPTSTGHVSARKLEETVRSGYRLFAHCYRDGLDRDPGLSGVIRLNFTVASDGTVERVENQGSDLPDQWVVDCVAEAFYALKFVAPNSGKVTALYRIVFDSG